MKGKLGVQLGVIGAIVLVVIFIAANAHLVTVSILSQPGCAPIVEGQSPAKRIC